MSAAWLHRAQHKTPVTSTRGSQSSWLSIPPSTHRLARVFRGCFLGLPMVSVTPLPCALPVRVLARCHATAQGRYQAHSAADFRLDRRLSYPVVRSRNDNRGGNGGNPLPPPTIAKSGGASRWRRRWCGRRRRSGSFSQARRNCSRLCRAATGYVVARKRLNAFYWVVMLLLTWFAVQYTLRNFHVL